MTGNEQARYLNFLAERTPTDKQQSPPGVAATRIFKITIQSESAINQGTLYQALTSFAQPHLFYGSMHCRIAHRRAERKKPYGVILSKPEQVYAWIIPNPLP